MIATILLALLIALISFAFGILTAFAILSKVQDPSREIDDVRAEDAESSYRAPARVVLDASPRERRTYRQLLIGKAQAWDDRADRARNDLAHELWHDAAKELRELAAEESGGSRGR